MNNGTTSVRTTIRRHEGKMGRWSQESIISILYCKTKLNEKDLANYLTIRNQISEIKGSDKLGVRSIKAPNIATVNPRPGTTNARLPS